MYVLVSGAAAAPQVAVFEIDNLRALDVRLAGVDDVAAARALRESGLGEVDGDHAWLDTAALRATGPDAPEWRSGFDGMVGYAATNGWTSADGTQVRAHLVRS